MTFSANKRGFQILRFCRPHRFAICPSILLAILMFAQATSSKAQEPATTPPPSAANEQQSTGITPENRQELFDRLQKNLNGRRLIGSFTISGTDQLRAEEYHILSAEKLTEGDYWKLTARIKYGEHDVTMPIVLEIKWAGSTPVITVDRLTLPGLGTFDARVVLRKDMYAGTWAHDDVSGHLFGRIEKLQADSKNSGKSKEKDNADKKDDQRW
jgi:hypothetical protein